MTTVISRRALLRAGGATAVAALLGACSEDPVPTEVLTIIIASFEGITGPKGRITMGILGEDNRPVLDAEPLVTVTRDAGDGTTTPVLTDAVPLYYGEGLGDRGVYVLDTDLEEPGIHYVDVTVPDRGRGQAGLNVVDPADSIVFAPGAEFPSLATPTTDDPGPLQSLCTQEPPCSMHVVSLDEALGVGPVVLSIATPQFCQTAVCGPVVSVVEQVRDEVDRDDVTFIHVEVYVDEGQTPTPTVDELRLPTEPWTWVLAGSGTVTDRFDGPVVPSLLAESVRAL